MDRGDFDPRRGGAARSLSLEALIARLGALAVRALALALLATSVVYVIVSRLVPPGRRRAALILTVLALFVLAVGSTYSLWLLSLPGEGPTWAWILFWPVTWVIYGILTAAALQTAGRLREGFGFLMALLVADAVLWFGGCVVLVLFLAIVLGWDEGRAGQTAQSLLVIAFDAGALYLVRRFLVRSRRRWAVVAGLAFGAPIAALLMAGRWTLAPPDRPGPSFVAGAVDARSGRVFLLDRTYGLLVLDSRTGRIMRAGLLQPPGQGDAAILIDERVGHAFIAVSTAPYGGIRTGPTILSVLNTQTLRVLHTSVIGIGPTTLALDTHTERLIATNQGDDTASVVDATTGAVLKTVPGWRGHLQSSLMSPSVVPTSWAASQTTRRMRWPCSIRARPRWCARSIALASRRAASSGPPWTRPHITSSSPITARSSM